jgi:GNAT superfamily N-acetyltransferase
VTDRAAPPATIRELSADEYRAAIPGLAALIVDAVDSGAGVNFLAGVTADEAAGWWTDRIDQVRRGVISAFVAVDGDGDGDGDGQPINGATIVGSAILIRSINPNSPHRAEIGKVLVLQSARRRGIATALMHAAEARARADGRWMLMLDTVTGSAADTFYRVTGWNELGIMPNHALTPDGTPAATTFFWKDLR